MPAWISDFSNEGDTMNTILALLAVSVILQAPVLSFRPWNEGEKDATTIAFRNPAIPIAEKDNTLNKPLNAESRNEQNLVLGQSVGVSFSGCYSDTERKILESAERIITSDNINANCQASCKDKGYSVVSTKGSTCYCTNSLPFPMLYPANHHLAAGNNGPCSVTCPGAWVRDNCQGDECCGGERAYSVFTLGQTVFEEKFAQAEKLTATIES